MSSLRFTQGGLLKRLAACRRSPAYIAIVVVDASMQRQMGKPLLTAFTHSRASSTWMSRRLCSTMPNSSLPPLSREASSLGDKEAQTLHPSPSSSSSSDIPPEELTRFLHHAGASQLRLVRHFANLPLDRRLLYRDHLLQDAITSYQEDLNRLFLLLYSHLKGTSSAAPQRPPSVTRETLHSLKTAWLSLRDAPSTPPKDAALRAAYMDEVRAFYSALLCSGVLTTEAELRLALSELQDRDLLEPSASFYESLFIALWTLVDVRRDAAIKHEDAAKASTPAESSTDSARTAPSHELVVGEARQLQRSLVGDLACHYLGHALAQPRPPVPHPAAVRRETWELFFCTFANAQPAPKLMDLWWSRFLEWVDDTQAAAASQAAFAAGGAEGVTVKRNAPLPYQAVHAVLAWCAQSRDMERALQYFKTVNQRGVTLHADTCPLSGLAPRLVGALQHAGSLTAKSPDAGVQQLQLALLVKLMASTKSVKFDGGLRGLVVRDVQRQIDPAVLYAAPWGVLNDLLSGLSVPSAMQLLRRCSLLQQTSEKQKSSTSTSVSSADSKEADDGAKPQKGREIPFYIWASLLRRCSREHLQDQAESLFHFLRHKFRLSALEKRELVEILMRMYVTMQPADFPSALDLFLQHVLRHPPNEPVISPDGVLYELLIKGADSRNASMMLFLEACGSGVSLTPELFEALMGATQFKTVASLSRKLPHGYAASSLDAQLRIPAEADAHLRREEALRARGKPHYDSTGDAE